MKEIVVLKDVNNRISYNETGKMNFSECMITIITQEAMLNLMKQHPEGHNLYNRKILGCESQTSSITNLTQDIIDTKKYVAEYYAEQPLIFVTDFTFCLDAESTSKHLNEHSSIRQAALKHLTTLE